MTVMQPASQVGWDVLLRDGRIARVRPFVPDDEAALLDLNARVSAHTRLMRYFSVAERPGQWYVEHLLQQAALGNALVGVVDDEVVAVASYARLETDPGTADLGLMVDDGQQASGLGSLLLEHLAHNARAHGLQAFHADVLGDNHHMLRMLRSSGFAVSGTAEGGVVELTVDLRDSHVAQDAAARREIVAERASLRRVLVPRSCAVVGSRREGGVAQHVFAAARSFGFAGPLHLVDRPNSLAALPGRLDLVVVAVPSERVLEVAQEAADAGAAGLVVLSAGFAETGQEGAHRQDDLLALCRTAGMRLIGPNCLGLLNTDPEARLNATFCEVSPTVGGVALISQSGAVGVAALRNAERRRTGLSLFVSTGNKADVSGNDLLEYLADDDRTTVVGMYLESFGNPRKFLRVAGALSHTKPVVVVKAGRTAAGAEAGRSHTAAAATSDATTEALLRASGVLRADDLSELFDLVSLLSATPLPTGPAVAVLGNSGGAGVLAVDALVAAGLSVAALTPETELALRRVVPASASVSNPVDLLATVTPQQLREAAVLLLEDPGVDAVISLYTPLAREHAEPYAEALVKASQQVPGVPLLVSFPGLADPPYGLARNAQPDLPFFSYPEQAARALAKALGYARWRAEAQAGEPVSVELPRLRTPRVERLLATAATGDRWLGPDEVSLLLDAAGIPEAAPAGVLPTSPGLELLAGAYVDPSVGPVVLVGLGGTLTDIVDDRVLRVPPSSRAQAIAQLQELRCAPALQGFRGLPALAVGAACDVLVALGHLLEACPEVREVDLNPLLLTSEGAWVLDARIAVAPVEQDPSAPFRSLRPPLLGESQ